MRLSWISCLYAGLQRLKMEAPARLMIQSWSGTAPIQGPSWVGSPVTKLIPGVHPKLPGDAQEQVKRIYKHAEEHRQELNLYIGGEEAEEEVAERDLPAGDPEAQAPQVTGT